MKKQPRRRLELRRNTLRNLSDGQLGQVGGGTIQQSVACTTYCITVACTAGRCTTATCVTAACATAACGPPTL